MSPLESPGFAADRSPTELAGDGAHSPASSLRRGFLITFPLFRSRNLVFPPKPIVLAATHPPRRVDLVNGDRLTCELLPSPAHRLHLRWLGQVRLQIPTSQIARIASLPGERDVLAESFSAPLNRQDPLNDEGRGESPMRRDGLLSVPSQSPPIRLSIPNCSGDFRCTFCLRVVGTEPPAAPRWVWSADFSADEHLQAVLDERHTWRVESSLPGAAEAFRQAVAAPSGWHAFRLQRTADRVFLSLDDALLYAGPSPNGALSAWSIQGDSKTPDRLPMLQIDQFSVVECHLPSVEFPGPLADADAILGQNGETWWGRLHDVGPEGVLWRDDGTTWRRSWQECAAIVWHRPEDPIAGRELTGEIVTLRLQSSTDRPDLPGDELTVSLGASRDGWLEAEHPLLGRLVLPRSAIQRVERRWTGRSKLWDARETAIGRERPEIAGRFQLTDIPSEPTYVSLEVSGLEPSGPQTPRGSPTLSDLRAGRLATELYINDKFVGRYNALTSDWSLPGEFDRLRLPVPREFLTVGENSWRIAQRPGGGPRRRFNECRIRNIAWETASPSLRP